VENACQSGYTEPEVVKWELKVGPRRYLHGVLSQGKRRLFIRHGGREIEITLTPRSVQIASTMDGHTAHLTLPYREVRRGE
jgi:hypothetical protein